MGPNLPCVLIGSTSFKIHKGLSPEVAIEESVDVDIINPNKCSIFDYQLGKIDEFEFEKIKDVYWYIFNLKSKVFVDVYDEKVILCPLDVLYILYKSHIHRIIRYTGNVYFDAKEWVKKMFMYNEIREKLGYKKMDKLIFNQTQSPLSKLYFKQWGIITSRHGDCKNSFDKSLQEFFQDDIDRVIDHDDLHVIVAKHFRNTSDLIFKKALKNKDDVEMDHNLFMNLPSSERIQCIFEEVCVLLIERPILCGLNTSNFMMSAKRNYINDTISHFATNLNGNGHHWLRRYVIDHCHVIYRKIECVFDDLVKIGVDIIKNLNLDIGEEDIEYMTKIHDEKYYLKVFENEYKDYLDKTPNLTFDSSKIDNLKSLIEVNYPVDIVCRLENAYHFVRINANVEITGDVLKFDFGNRTLEITIKSVFKYDIEITRKTSKTHFLNGVEYLVGDSKTPQYLYVESTFKIQKWRYNSSCSEFGYRDVEQFSLYVDDGTIIKVHNLCDVCVAFFLFVIKFDIPDNYLFFEANSKLYNILANLDIDICDYNF